MLTGLMVLLRSIGMICRGHEAVALENLALRQQIAALTRTVKRPQLRTRDRLFWIVLAKGWREWRTALIVVQRRGAVAPPVAPSAVDVALHTDTSGAAQYGCDGSNARRKDGRGESAVGSAANSRRIVQAGHRAAALPSSRLVSTVSITVPSTIRCSASVERIGGVAAARGTAGVEISAGSRDTAGDVAVGGGDAIGAV
jgi:hypothetical protein